LNDQIKPELDITGLSTSLHIKDLKMMPFGTVSLNTQGPVRSFAEARACGKVILCGEHAVVYGAKALALPLLSKVIHIKLYADQHITASPKIRVNLGERPANEAIQAMVTEAFDVLGIARFNLSIEGHSNLMLGAGVGSSASLCVSVLRGLSQLSGKPVPPKDLAQLANQLERRFHGNPSGLDTAVVALEQAILFEKGKTPEIITVKKPKDSRFPWSFVLIDSGVRAPTINMVKHAEPVFRAKGQAFLNEFDDATLACKAGLETGDIKTAALAMNTAQLLLTELGVVNNALQDIVRATQSIGAAAVKVTGAGGGGCMLALLHGEDCDDQIAALRRHFGSDRIHPLFIP